MISGIVAILGALAGIAPGILQWLTLKANNAHAIELERLRIEAARQSIALQVDLAGAQSDIQQQQHIYNYAAGASGVKWVDALAIFVRPYITLIMFHAWIALEALLLLYGIANGVSLEKMAELLWDDEVQNLFSAIVGFWFGNRMLMRGQQMAATMAITAAPSTVGAKPASGSILGGIRRPPQSGGVIPDPPGSRT